MKTLETNFVYSPDRCKNHKFEQRKRTPTVALYERKNNKGRTIGFEVFVVKIIKAGTPLPGGLKVQETYERYPGVSAFGSYAYYCLDIENAEKKFNELVKQNPTVQIDSTVESDETNISEFVSTGEPAVSVSNVVGKRGRKKLDVQFDLPASGETFTMKELASANTKYTQPLLYLRVQELLKNGKVIVSGSIKTPGQRGKPTLVYKVN